MTQLESPYGPRNIGEEATPPYAVLPDPLSLFLYRSKRLRSLASGHVLEAYLNFAADLTQAQHDISAKLPDPELPAAAQIQQALDHGLPPLSRGAYEPDAAAGLALKSLLERLRDNEMPKEAADAVSSLLDVSGERRHQLMSAALKGLPAENIAERSLVLTALQVHFANMASKLSANTLQPVADGVCPTCGSPPMTSSVVGWPKAHNTRFCACSLCGTMWHVVRVKCVLCSSTKGIGYQSIEGQPESVKAETCEECHRYVKILYQVKDHLLDPMADDIATLGLDMLLAEEGWKRGGVNPFLLGY
jgi:FdhE protein